MPTTDENHWAGSKLKEREYGLGNFDEMRAPTLSMPAGGGTTILWFVLCQR